MMRKLVSCAVREGSRRWIAWALIVALMPTIIGCYGSFPITRTVYRFNGSVTDSTIVHSLIFWGLVILPVYELATLGDVFILNVLEFLSGRDTGTSQLDVRGEGSHLALRTTTDGREARLTVWRGGENRVDMRFIKAGDNTFDVCDATGTRIGKVVRTADSDLLLQDVHGTTIRTVSGRQIAAERTLRLGQ